MRVLNKTEFEQQQRTLLKELKNNVFIYPTDSIYGIGCDATNHELVEKVRELKNSTLQPFSIIAPSKEWVRKHCDVTPQAEEWVEQLGRLIDIDGERRAVSLILKLKNKKAVAHNVNPGKDTISVRIPDHWFASVVNKLGVPVITTSANPTGGDFMTSLEDLHPRIKRGVQYCIYEGEKKGNPSTLVHLDQEEVKVKKR
ncbi:Sua5/YciO/YrdC/YwlC family protein [Candidatus Woesearchaeota archaeon]|nr:Sua5/YciO/YrdC/YwlC family protein [Candidatus Woesearchaeota archaeon]